MLLFFFLLVFSFLFLYPLTVLFPRSGSRLIPLFFVPVVIKVGGQGILFILYLVPGWCECKGNNGAGEAGEGFQRAVGSLVVECPVVGVS